MVSYYLEDDLKPEVRSAVVVTPTIGSRFLSDCIESVEAQDVQIDFQHLVVFDGPVEYNKKVPENVMVLPWNVGRHGFYGHRVYAAIGHLINADSVLFLDEDNMYDKDHVQSCIDTLNGGNDFCHSFRSVIDIDGNWLCDDKFEAIGREPYFLVDTSSFCFRKEFLIEHGHHWHWGWGADRRFFQIVKDQSRYASTGRHTLMYRLDGNPNSPTKEFFFNGNERIGYDKTGKEILK